MVFTLNTYKETGPVGFTWIPWGFINCTKTASAVHNEGKPQVNILSPNCTTLNFDD